MSNPGGRPRSYPDAVLSCRQCGGSFTMMGSEAKAYVKKHGREKPFCSMKCFYESAHRHPRDLTEAAPMYECQGCHQMTPRRRDTLGGKRAGGWDLLQKYCSSQCFHESRFARNEVRRAEGDLPKGHISQDGYHVVKMGHGRQVKMHRWTMEQHLKRKLRGNENVHHKNGNRADNRLENLELWVKTQPCGQRAVDKVAAALDLLRGYPELVREAGYCLCSQPDICRGG